MIDRTKFDPTGMDPQSVFPAPIRSLPSIGRQVSGYQLKAPGCEVLFLAAAAGTELPRHDHGTENATVTVSGETVIVTDEGERRCGPGEWYQTRPGQMHAIRFEVDTVQIELRFDVPRAGTDG